MIRTHRPGPSGTPRRCLRRLMAAASAAALATGALAACSLVGGSESSDSAASQKPHAPQSAPQEVASVLENTQASAGSTAPVSVSSELPVIAERDGVGDDVSLKIALNSVTVSGGTTTVLFSVTNTEGEAGDDWQVADHLSDGVSGVPLNADGAVSDKSGDGSNTDGVTVLDTTNQQVYRAAYDTGGNCLCSSTSSQFIEPGYTVVFQTTFAALPEDVGSVTVSIPMAGAFENVPVTR